LLDLPLIKCLLDGILDLLGDIQLVLLKLKGPLRLVVAQQSLAFLELNLQFLLLALAVGSEPLKLSLLVLDLVQFLLKISDGAVEVSHDI
jgi:hypothetical protein